MNNIEMEADYLMYLGNLDVMSMKSGPAFKKATRVDDDIRLQKRSHTGVG